MPKLNLTDLAIQRLKAEDGQTRYFDEATPGFGILVGKKTKTFFVVTGKERRMQTLGAYPSVSLKDARSEAKRILADPNAPKARTTYAEAVEAYLKARKPQVKAVTYQHYAYYLNTLALKGNLAELTKGDIKTGLAIWEGKKRAQNACHSALRTFLNWCVEEEIIDRHPLYRSRAPNKTPSRDRVLTDAELVAIWNATDFKPYGHLIRLLMLTAARKMEVRNLVIDGEYITFKATKNKLDHSLPITPLIRAHLISEPYKFDNWEREKRRLDKKCGVYGWTVHDLRRTAATNMARLGVPSDHVEAVLNHKQEELQATYQRWRYAPQIQEALLTLEAHILKLTTARASTQAVATAPSESCNETAKQEGIERENESESSTPRTA